MKFQTGIVAIFFSLVFATGLLAQTSSMDRVFILGEEEAPYEKLTSIYSQSLLEASNLDINQAFSNWLGMMQEIDRYADQINFNIKGVKVWMHVFWQEDGTIDKFGFLLRPDSRFINQEELQAFFASFIRQYKFTIKSNRKFNHYTGATFPTMTQRSNN